MYILMSGVTPYNLIQLSGSKHEYQYYSPGILIFGTGKCVLKSY